MLAVSELHATGAFAIAIWFVVTGSAVWSLATLAQWYHDSRPITQAWLDHIEISMMGATEPGEEPYPHLPFGAFGNTIGVIRYYGKWQVIVSDDEGDDMLVLAEVKTRGEVRGICKSIGCEIKE